MKKVLSLLLLLTISGLTQSFSQNSPDLIIENFFSLLKAGNPKGAIESLPVGSNIKSDTSFTAKTVSILLENQKSLGKYCGYELIGENEVTASYIISDYLIKYLNAPRRIQFIFYKPVDNWQVNMVNLNVRGNQSNTGKRTSRRL